MGYTIAQAAQRTGMTAYTLRYYDKEGLLPLVGRDASGNREFQESDFEWLATINCLKNTGMPIKDIKQYLEWVLEGVSTMEKRLEVFEKQKKLLEEKMEELQKYMDRIDHKIEYYTASIESGSMEIHNRKRIGADKH